MVAFHSGARTEPRRHQKKADSGTVLVYADARCRRAGLVEAALSYEATVYDIEPFAPAESVGRIGPNPHRGGDFAIEPCRAAEH